MPREYNHKVPSLGWKVYNTRTKMVALFRTKADLKNTLGLYAKKDTKEIIEKGGTWEHFLIERVGVKFTVDWHRPGIPGGNNAGKDKDKAVLMPMAISGADGYCWRISPGRKDWRKMVCG